MKFRLIEQDLDNQISEKFIYRGESDTTYSKHHEAKAGIFFAIDKKGAAGFGEVNKYKLTKNANIFEYYNSDKFVYDNNYNSKNYPELQAQFGFNSIDEFTNSTNKHDKNYYLTWLFMEQLVAKIELEKQGYDGAFWNGREDDGLFKQYQIWNLNILQKVPME